jgi:hypothetical protein
VPLICKTCESPDRAEIEALAHSGRPIAAIAREFDLSYPSVRGHFAKAHHIRVRPRAYQAEPERRWYVYTREEMAIHVAAAGELDEELAARSGISVAQLRRCREQMHLASHPKPCASCAVFDKAADLRYISILGRRKRETPHEAGRYVGRAEAERLLDDPELEFDGLGGFIPVGTGP